MACSVRAKGSVPRTALGWESLEEGVLADTTPLGSCGFLPLSLGCPHLGMTGCPVWSQFGNELPDTEKRGCSSHGDSTTFGQVYS